MSKLIKVRSIMTLSPIFQGILLNLYKKNLSQESRRIILDSKIIVLFFQESSTQKQSWYSKEAKLG